RDTHEGCEQLLHQFVLCLLRVSCWVRRPPLTAFRTSRSPPFPSDPVERASGARNSRPVRARPIPTLTQLSEADKSSSERRSESPPGGPADDLPTPSARRPTAICPGGWTGVFVGPRAVS